MAATNEKLDFHLPDGEICNMVSHFKWEYLAEGCSSIVFYCKNQQLVLRFKKKHDLYDFPLYQQLKFLEFVLKPVFQDESYFSTYKLVELSNDFGNVLKQMVLLSETRPDERLGSDVDAAIKQALVLPHLGFIKDASVPNVKGLSAAGGAFAVEIKPKWGYLPEPSCTIIDSHKVKLSKCRFCMHQHLKYKHGKIASKSEYCPLDLFANCSCRVRKALKSLFETPQNNLRIFFEGEVIYSGLAVNGTMQDLNALDNFLLSLDEDTAGTKASTGLNTEKLIDIITQIIYDDSWKSRKQTVTSAGKFASKCCSFEQLGKEADNKCKSLGVDGVLNKLVSAQKLDELDIQGIYPLFKELQSSEKFDELVRELGNFHSASWRDFIENFKNREKLNKKLEKDRTKNVIQIQEAVMQIQRFLVAATFKDCSIMIAFQKLKKESNYPSNIAVIENTADIYGYQIKLFDLDPKSIHRINHYYALDHDIIQNYVFDKEGTKCCN